MLDQDNNFYLISLSILITCLLDNVWILQGEVTCQSLQEIILCKSLYARFTPFYPVLFAFQLLIKIINGRSLDFQLKFVVIL